MTLWITQWLCPQRHCLFMLTWNPDEGTSSAEAKKIGEGYFDSIFSRVCALCGSEDIKAEEAKTIFKDLEEAEPALMVSQMHQLEIALATEKLKEMEQ